MGMAAILVMWPGPFEHLFVPLSQGGSTQNLALIRQAVSEMIFRCDLDHLYKLLVPYPIKAPHEMWLWLV